MTRRSIYSGVVMALLLALMCGPLLAKAPKNNPIQFLTGPQQGEPLALAKAYLDSRHAELGLTSADITDMEVSDHYRSSHNGVTHIYFIQRHAGIPVWNGLININVASDGTILNMGNRFVSDLAGKINTTAPSISADTAVQRAADHLGVTPQGLSLLTNKGGDVAAATFSKAGISRDPIPVQLKYVVTEDGAVHLVWDTVINMVENLDWWNLHVDALNGAVISQDNWTDYESVDGEGVTNAYNVFPLPAENPDDTPQTLTADPADPTASPFGWHDDDGVAGAEYTDTRGNNVHAQDDLDANNTGGSRPDGGANLVFDFPWDEAEQPGGAQNLDAAITNLFYYNNIMHDIAFQYGFDEASGNFQTLNYTGQGADGDHVIADAQDGSSTNNATFSTPIDGFSGRMTMFIWTPPGKLTVNSPASIAGEYEAGSASFGAPLTGAGLTGDVVLVDDGTGTGSDSCEASPTGAYTGMIALLDRGSCEFGVKVLNAENAGAIGAIVVNNVGTGAFGMGPGAVGDMVTIPSIGIAMSDGDLLKAQLPTPGVNTTLSLLTPINRDSDLDNGIIGHEYGHGISNRLTGGPSQVGCLNGTEQAGEGWSDFWSLVLTATADDTPSQLRGIGNYVIYEDATGGGIRNFPYTTDFSANPQTYANISATNVPHGVGEIWMDMVWEMYWELVIKHGFDPDFYNGTGGNNLTIQLVMDGMKLQPCNPTFVDARDAILMADMVNNGGENQCEIWRAFGKRGVGVNAIGGIGNVGDETEDFTIPLGCEADLFIDGFESGNTSAWSNSAGEP